MPKKTIESAPQIVINSASQPAATVEPEKPQEREEKEPGWFFDEMMKIPGGDWEKIYHLELERLEPKIPGVPGSKGYLWTFFAPITKADVKKRWGGGKFRLDLCRNGRFWKTHHFDIEGDPIYDRSREVPPAANGNGAGAVANADFQREFISVLRDELQRSRESGQANGSEHVIEMLTKASERAMEIITKQAPSAVDPTAQLTALLGAAQKLAELRTPTNSSGTLSEAIQLLSTLGVLQKPKTLTEQIAEAKALKDLLSGVSDAEPGDWKAMLVKGALERAPEILDAIKAPATAAQARAAEANARARAAETLRTVPTNQPRQAAPQPVPASGLNLEPRDAAGSTPAATPQAQPAPMPMTQEQYDEGMKVQIVNMFRYGASGSAIAAFLEDIKPQMAEDLVKFPAQSITDFFLKDPILKLMAADPRWPEVLTEAREYLSETEVTVN